MIRFVISALCFIISIDMYRKILLLNLCIFIVGCSRWQMKDEIKSFLGKTVCFPNNLIAVHNGM